MQQKINNTIRETETTVAIGWKAEPGLKWNKQKVNKQNVLHNHSMVKDRDLVKVYNTCTQCTCSSALYHVYKPGFSWASLCFVPVLAYLRLCQLLRWWIQRWMLVWCATKPSAKFSTWSKAYRYIVMCVWERIRERSGASFGRQMTCWCQKIL